MTVEIPSPPRASSAAVRAVMQANRKVDTRPEAAVRSAMHRRGLRFRKHARPLPDLNCVVDIVFRHAKIAVFVDGCFWHGCPYHGTAPQTNAPYWSAKIARNVERDRRNDAALAKAGWRVVRIWEHEDPEEAAARIHAFVRGRTTDAGL